MIRNYLYIILLISPFFFVNIAGASLISINLQDGGAINFERVGEFIYINKNDTIDSIIGIEFWLENISNKTINLSIYIYPADNVKHIKNDSISEPIVSLCKGEIENPGYTAEKKCDVKETEIPLTCNRREYLYGAGNENYSEISFRCSKVLNAPTLNIKDRYAILIKYNIKNFIVKQGDFHTFIGLDSWSYVGEKAIILPQNAILSKLEGNLFPTMSANKQWVIWVKEKQGNWYNIIYEIEPWYKGIWGYMLAFLIGGIILFIIDIFTTKKIKKSVINRINKVVNKLIKNNII
ncbi:hypothetical protein HYT26_00085 [Candidatus Pacearchaeota archaeon]|nr:hypothetical protein [Candidatus Pacearchaeota archaeon]